MDHNLDDQLTLESAMGVDYVHSDDAGNVKEEAIMMDTAGEEIIVTDYISNPYMLEEMPIEDSDMIQVMHSEEIIGSEEQVYSQDSMLDLQFEEPVSVPAANVIIDIPPSQPPAPRFVTLTQAPIHGVSPLAKKDARQVAIAPKVPRLVHVKRSFPALKSNLVASPALKPLAIAPKPATPQITNKHRSISLVKSSVSTTRANNSVLTPIGKQLVVVGAGGGSVGGVGSSAPRFRLLTQPGAELRLVPQSTGKTQTSTSSIQTPIAKIIQVQGSANSDSSPAVLTRIPKTGTGTSTTISTSIGTGTVTKQVFTMQQKTVPITLGNKQVIMASPTKQGVRYSQKQFITLKTPVKVSSAQDAQTKKVVITANPAQSNLVLKAGAKANQVNKIAPVVPKGQLHKISVPGKGIQYIRLVPTTSAKPATPPTPPPAKTLVFTDAKGNLIQVATDKVSTGQPPPLIVTENALNKCKLPPKKLVRIAPISKTVPVPTSMSQQTRAGQSLLAPITTKAESTPPPLQPITPNTQAPAETFYMEDDTQDGSDSEEEGDEITEIETTDSKTALHALIADTTAGENNTQQELPVEYCPDRDDQPNQSDHQGQPDRPHPLIVVPPSYMNQEQEEDNDKSITSEARRLGNMLNVEVDGYNLFQAGVEPGHDDDDLPTDIDGLRPRKACNCTKSQCLKLYCDCFANGEFCHQCNCNNCHNNLDHEELRQKAIRGCLDRNPNAFRPKIGKAKAGGLDLIRRHNKGCNCKRSGCLKNYCECYEAKIACTTICKCVGCRNVEETLERARRPHGHGHGHGHRDGSRPAHHHQVPAKQPCSFMTSEVITAVCQCLVAAAGEGGPDPVQGVLDEFARCLQDVIAAAQTKPRAVNQSNA